MRKAAFAVFIVLCAAACTSASGRPPASTRAVGTTTTSTTSPPTTTAPPPTTVPGPPYPVGSTTLQLVDTSRPTVSHGNQISTSRALTTLVWYPVVPGRHPLVVFAHGFQVGPAPYVTLLQAWAAHGYVVAAPEFPLTDSAIAGANLDEGDIDNQPADIRYVTDRLVDPSSPVFSRIDPGRVAVTGHSDGSESALAASIAAVPSGEPAYRALIAMSVQQLPDVAHTANPPMLVTQGDQDTINPPSYGYQVYTEGSSPKYLLVLKGGGHLPPLEPGSSWLPGIESVTEAFLDCYVAGDAPVAGIGAGATPPSRFGFNTG